MGLAGDSSHRQAAAVPGIKLCKAYAYNANQTALGWVEGWCMGRGPTLSRTGPNPKYMQVPDQFFARVQIHHRDFDRAQRSARETLLLQQNLIICQTSLASLHQACHSFSTA